MAFQPFSSLFGTFIQPFIGGTCLTNVVLRLAGCRMESVVDTIVHEAHVIDPSLTSIGRGAVLCQHANISAHSAEAQRLMFKRTTLGRGVNFHPFAMVLAGDGVGDGVTLCCHTSLTRGTFMTPDLAGPLRVVAGVPGVPCGAAPTAPSTAGGVNPSSVVVDVAQV